VYGGEVFPLLGANDASLVLPQVLHGDLAESFAVEVLSCEKHTTNPTRVGFQPGHQAGHALRTQIVHQLAVRRRQQLHQQPAAPCKVITVKSFFVNLTAGTAAAVQRGPGASTAWAEPGRAAMHLLTREGVP
jgi:hypothetical protein